jgi:two-component system nitrogen regulation sensor histidine kinase NtrY
MAPEDHQTIPADGSGPDREAVLTAERRKRRRERLLIALTLTLVVALTSVEISLVRRGGHPLTGSLLAFGLLNLNAILFLLFTFLIFRHLTKLFLERRQKVFGSRLRIRLVLTFIALALLPTLFMFFIAWQLISSRVDYQWGSRLEEVLGHNLVLSQAFTKEAEDKLTALSRLFLRELLQEQRVVDGPPERLQRLLADWRTRHELSDLEIVLPSGAVLAEARDPAAAFPKEPLPPRNGPDTAAEIHFTQTVAGGTLVSLMSPVPGPDGRTAAFLILRDYYPRVLPSPVAGAQARLQDIRAMQLLIRPVRISHYLTLVIVTLLTLMAAIWLAFYMAREITTPIRQVAEGTHKVAGGDFSFQIDLEGKDEIGFLVQSFNKMTQELRQNRAQLGQAYEQLRASHAELSSRKRHMEILLKNVAAGVIALDAQGLITTINDSAVQMLGFKREEVLGRPARDFVLPVQAQRLAEVVAEARRAPKGTVERPVHLTLPDRQLSLLLKPTVLKDDSGQDLGVVIVFEDLTELERAQRQAAWQEVARRIAHEMKNPLTPIKLAAQRLKRRYAGKIPDDGQVFEECTRIISDQVDHIRDLVNEFSRFARLPDLNLTPTDLNAIIQETLALYQEVRPNIRLSFVPDPSLPALLLDPEQMKRVLLNLVDNALGALSEGGEIRLTTRAALPAEQVELEVADTGPGIPDRDKSRVFEPYYSTRRGGTGLGLAIVNSIIADHGGRIRVEDNLPRGARFIIDLPLRRDHGSDHPHRR